MSTSDVLTQQSPGAIRSARCWELAVKIFNTSLTNDPKKIIYISAPSLGFASASYSSVIDEARNTIRETTEDRTKFRKTMEASLQVFNKYAVSIDILIQHQPHVTALIWGSIRTLVQVAVQEIEASAEIASSVGKIVGELGRWDQYLRLFPDSDRVLSTAAQLFAQVINYLMRATAYYAAPLVKRYLVASLSHATGKLQNILSDIDELSSNLEKETNLAAEEKHDKYRHDSLMSAQAATLIQRRTHDSVVDLRSTIDNISVTVGSREKELRLKRQVKHALKWLRTTHSQNPCSVYWEPGTAEWILNHPVYMQWEDDQCGSSLWILGIPGCGKSVMANFLARNSRTPITITHSLQAAINPNSTRPITVAASILAQLFRYDLVVSNFNTLSHMVQCVLPLLNHFSTYEECPFDQICSIIEGLLGLLPSVTLIIDALDECSAANNALELVRWFQHLSALPHARIIILSRRHPKFDSLLGFSAQIEMDEAALSDDISLFIQREVKRSPKIRLSQDIIAQKAKEQGNGMFLWARLMLDYLQKASTPRIQLNRLEKLPAGLAPMYEKMLEENGEKLETEQLVIRKNIFMLLAAATSPLCIEDISVALALSGPNLHPSEQDLLIEPQEQISTICWPFITIVNEHVQFVHYTMQEFLFLPGRTEHVTSIHFTQHQCHSYTALKCLFRMVNLDAGTSGILESLVRSNLGHGVSSHATAPRELPHQWPFYNYASKNWHLHVRSADNSMSILQLTSVFLNGPEHIAWSETILENKHDMGIIVDIHASLCSWHIGLSQSQKDVISLDRFFEKAYNDFIGDIQTQRRHISLEVAYMAMRRLGIYHNLGGTEPRGRTGKELRKVIAEGFSDTLGHRHPLTLRCTTDWCVEMIIDGERELLKGESILLQTLKHQREVVGVEVSDSFYTQQYAGLAMYYRAKFDDATQHLEKSCEGLERTLGPNHQDYLISRLYYAYALEGNRSYANAIAIYEEVWRLWSQLHGSHHPLSTMTQCNMAVAYRRLRRYNLAEKHIKECLVERQRLFGKSSVAVDSCINLAMLYRDMGRPEQADAYLKLTENVGLSDYGFERVCHVYHVRALLCVDSGDIQEATELLETIVLMANKHPANRALMWIRLNLAVLLRYQHYPAQALALFSNIVKSIGDSDDITGKPTPEYQLRAAEKALCIARENGLPEAEEWLKMQNLEWQYPQALWIIFGGPAADILESISSVLQY